MKRLYQFTCKQKQFGKENGVDAIVECLDKLFKKDSSVTKYQALEAFQTIKKPARMSIQAFLNEFDKRLYKTKLYGTVQSYNILAYCLLQSANLCNNHKELVKAAI